MANSPPEKHGSVGKRADGLPCVSFERRLPHSAATVWAAVAEPEQRATWMPGIQFEPQPKARFDIWFGEDCEGPAHVSGELGAFQPQRLLELGSIRFELEPLGDQDEGCLLRFSDVLWYDGKRSKRDFACAVLAGWHQFLDRLELWLDERRAAPLLPEPDYSGVELPDD